MLVGHHRAILGQTLYRDHGSAVAVLLRIPFTISNRSNFCQYSDEFVPLLVCYQRFLLYVEFLELSIAFLIAGCIDYLNIAIKANEF